MIPNQTQRRCVGGWSPVAAEPAPGGLRHRRRRRRRHAASKGDSQRGEPAGRPGRRPAGGRDLQGRVRRRVRQARRHRSTADVPEGDGRPQGHPARRRGAAAAVRRRQPAGRGRQHRRRPARPGHAGRRRSKLHRPDRRCSTRRALDDPAKKVRDTLLPGVDRGRHVRRQAARCSTTRRVLWGVWYSKSLFAKHGWTFPKTWDEMLTLGDEIKKAGVAPWTWQGKYPEYMNDPLLVAGGQGRRPGPGQGDRQPGAERVEEPGDAGRRRGDPPARRCAGTS